MRTRTRITLAGLVLGAALAGGVAWATIPGDGDVYTACKLNALGTIRLIDPSLSTKTLLGHCTPNETQITWSQKGPKGDTGAAGTNGTNGTNGINGAPCPASDLACRGPQGANGSDGTNGAPGADGAPGPKGDPCLPNVPECRGPQGDPGPRGEPGKDGAAGPQGPPASSPNPATVTDVPVGSRVTLSTSPLFGTISGSCAAQNPSNANERSLVVDVVNTTNGGRLFFVSPPAIYAAVGGTFLTKTPIFIWSVATTDPNRLAARVVHLVNFGIDYMSVGQFADEGLTIGGEILPSGDCRVSLAIATG
jgi:hypothetical protein